MARLAYLSLETPREGQASYTKVGEVVAGLRALGWAVDLHASRGGGASSGTSLAGRVIEQLALQIALARRVASYDVLYVRSHFMAWPVTWFAHLCGVPVVHEINGTPRDVVITYPALRMLSWLIQRSYRGQYRRAAHLVAVTEGLAVWAKAFAGHDRVSMVSNGANTDIFNPAGPADAELAPFVVFVGGLVAWHGIGQMLFALEDPAWPASVRLVIVGDGVERDQLVRKAGHPRLVYLGLRKQAEIAPLLRGAVSVLCVLDDPDRRSSTGVAPLKLLEAMACGAPVIVSDLPGQSDLVRRLDAGLVVPMGDAAALAAAVAELAGDKARARAMGLNGAAHVQAEASWRQQVSRLHSVLDQVAASRLARDAP
ncbi:glycosyltransferase [Phreatobacter sp.]|uniref:glycosyltransferase n=1 Tax=Phreatobacter sp. TaxID=1966341 RepID=UPI0022C80EA1|nr:glycosyltransferase [Phreatobacter sp.]MCZ8316888.1 glycosyltransferase [Phreatobacter sp.]